jgi:leucine dehydrogenase
MVDFDLLSEMGHEEVVFCNNPEMGLRAIIAIHSTALGPALGGCRMWEYASDDEAVRDVLNLSKGMTYKAAVAGLDLGGGKAVIIGDSSKDKSEALFRAFGRFVESLNGRYITAEDVGTTVNDMEYVFRETDHVTGVLPVHGGSGDPSPFTAFGVLQGIKACIKRKINQEHLRGLRVAVQGLGNVGGHLARLLKEEGVEVVGTDISDEQRDRLAKELGIKVVAPDDIYSVDCDVFSPCALGGAINDDTIKQLNCQIVAGAANNQLKEPRHGDELAQKDILYAPDYAINSGGLINVSLEMEGYDRERAYRLTGEIYKTILNIFNLAEEEEIPIYKAADRLAEKRIKAIRSVHSRSFLPEEVKWRLRSRKV